MLTDFGCNRRSDFSSPFGIQDPPLSLYEHFFVIPCDKDSRIIPRIPLVIEWGTVRWIMADLGCRSYQVIRALKEVFRLIIQSSFWHRFSFGCPSYMSSVRCLSFLPHVLGLNVCWRQVNLEQLSQGLGIQLHELLTIIEWPHLVKNCFPVGHELGQRISTHRLNSHQGLPTRLRHLSCWNINSWRNPDRPSGDYKMRRVKRLLRKGPVLLQETRWSSGQEETVSQYLPGVTVCSAPPISTGLGNPSGGTSVLLPAGWQVVSKVILVPGKAVAVLLSDRGCQFYLISVYLHPDRVKEDLQELTRAWVRWDKVTARIIICGDFNNVDRVDRTCWDQFLSQTGTCDVAPELATHVTAQSVSYLDRCLISEGWISSAQWNPILKATHTQRLGHRIVQMHLRVRPTVLNNPRHPKHVTVTIPASVFMPGRDGNPAQAGSDALQSLVSLHRTRAQYLSQQFEPRLGEEQAASASNPHGQHAPTGEELSSSHPDSSEVLAHKWSG